MQINKDLLTFFEELLGPGIKQNKSYYSFNCPLQHHKKSRLWVEFDTGKYQCFACQDLKGTNFYTLLKKIKPDNSKFTQLSKILNDDIKINSFEIKNKNNDENILKLPDDFHPLWKTKKSIEYKNALYYIIKKRKLTLSKIKKYNIGYSENSEYANRIIIPSYDKNGDLNYFTSRTYYDNVYKSYKNPYIPRINIIPFEQYISWNIPIILVEGFFDAISVDYNAIPLLGKKISDKFILKLIENNIEWIYLMLDGDAIKDYVKIIQYLKEYDISVKPIFLKSNEDPDNLSQKEIFIKCKNAKIFTNEDNLKLKMRFI